MKKYEPFLAFIFITGAGFGFMYWLGSQMPAQGQVSQTEMLVTSGIVGLLGAFVYWLMFRGAKEAPKMAVVPKIEEVQGIVTPKAPEIQVEPTAEAEKPVQPPSAA